MRRPRYLGGSAILVTIATLSSCGLLLNSESVTPSFKVLEFTYDSGWSNTDAFSIKIDSQGKAIVSKNRWEPRRYYQGRVSQPDLSTLFSIFRNSQLQKLDSTYTADTHSDQHTYVILMTRLDSSIQKVRVYGEIVPAQLDSLQGAINLIKDTLSLHRMKGPFQFKSRIGFYPILPK